MDTWMSPFFMTPDDSQGFFHELFGLTQLFCDPMNEARQRQYWDFFRTRCTLLEWEAACALAMERETFHKVPLPAKLMEHVTAVRTAWMREARKRAQALEEAERHLKLVQSPQRSALSDEEIQRNFQQLLATLGEAVAMPAPRITERIPAYRTPLDESEFLDRQRRLIEQAQQLQESPADPPKDAEA